MRVIKVIITFNYPGDNSIKNETAIIQTTSSEVFGALKGW